MKSVGERWKRGVFTVEAAVVVPLSLWMIALLIGFCFFTHQSGWCKGAAWESAIKGAERTTGEAGEKADKRMAERLQEIPLDTGRVETDVASGLRLRVSWSSTVLPEVFSDRFVLGGEVSFLNLDPVRLKQAEFIVRQIKE